MKEEEQEKRVSPEKKFNVMQQSIRRGDSDLKLFASETKAALIKQHTQIDNYRNLSNNLKENIVKNHEDYMGQTDGFMNLQSIDYQKRYELEEKKYNENMGYIRTIQENIVEKKSEIGGVNAGLENQNSLVKQIKILENRLDKANQKFNEAISVNKNLRQQIDSLRRERVIFDNLYKKLEKELHDKRKKMAEIIETANNAYEERDKANDQIESLRSKAKREANDFENELKEISQLAETNRMAIELISKTNEKKNERQEAYDMAQTNDKMNKNKSSKGLKSQNVDSSLQEKNYKLRLDYVKIELTTNIKKFDKLIETFKTLEEENFDKFKYVIELSNQIEFLEHQIAEYKEDMRKYEEKGSNATTAKKNKHLKELDEKTVTCQQRSQFFETKYNSAQKILNSITTLVEKLFNEIECDKAEANKTSGTQGVGESNLLQYLGIVERRLTRVLDAYMRIMVEKNQGWGGMNPRGEAQKMEGRGQKVANMKMPDIGSQHL